MTFDDSIHQCRWTSPLGPMILAATRHGLAGVWFDDQRHLPEHAAWPVNPNSTLLQQTVSALEAYFRGARARFEMALDLRGGTPFQQAVWAALLQIPYGQTTSYGELSHRIGKPQAVRAVGAAVGRNPISIVVPCHRVLGSKGALTGYAGGLMRKTALLQQEGTL